MTWHDVDVYKSIHVVRWVIPSCFCARKRRTTFAVFPPSLPSCVFLRYVMADVILVEAVSEGDGCSGLLLWTLVCAVVFCFLVVELDFLWVFLRVFSPNGFFTSVFFPCGDVGQHPPKSKSCVPPGK